LGARNELLIADDPKGFADAVQALLDDRDRALKLGAAGRASYLERYTWAEAWQKLTSAGI
jgi:glycosyltransferase involved in cell wall biosynthesis